jgi:acetylglutamate kinase
MKENMYYGADAEIFRRAELLRSTMTEAEEILWNAIHINPWHLKFRRQHPLNYYIVDFYCHSIKLVIELDGKIHLKKEVKEIDEDKEGGLKSLGLTVLRFKNEEVLTDLEGVLNKIKKVVKNSRESSVKEVENLSQSKGYPIQQSGPNPPLGDGGFKQQSNKDFPIQHSSPNPPLGDGGGDEGKRPLFIIKIGGNIIDDEKKLAEFLKDFASIKEKKILVHGGGKLATQLAEKMNVPQQMREGRRITDAETLKVVTMVYAGYINKNIVAQLQSFDCNAAGFCGADGNLIQAHKRRSDSHLGSDFGFVGDIDSVNEKLFEKLLNDDLTPVIAPVSHDNNGQLLNTNADTIAQEIAKGMAASFAVRLVYCFEKKGVLLNSEDDDSVIDKISASFFKELKEKKVIHSGMIPKLDNAFAALESGVDKVIIGKAEELGGLVNGSSGTMIIHE